MNTTPRSCWSGAARPFHPFGQRLFMLLSALLLIALPVPTLAAPGDLDPSFDGDGRVLTDFGGFERVNALVGQPDGKVVAAGDNFLSDGSNFALARYNHDGRLDSRFGGDGRVVTAFNGSNSNNASALVVQPDGKLVAGGSARFTLFALARYNRDGSLDRSFGGDGRVVTSVDRRGSMASVSALVVQPDGKLVAAGNRLLFANGAAIPGLVVARYNHGGETRHQLRRWRARAERFRWCRCTRASARWQAGDGRNAVCVQ